MVLKKKGRIKIGSGPYIVAQNGASITQTRVTVIIIQR